ncbi:unnamed protein product [Paramecium sonneborni]|uniref:Uncharacterized protein n=1 Tax=Paramecium sonneborni TaxID=65129 RepID=A0A8S1M1Q5_9CILI|nr:unnamed protein product [Paramecium sonneborni]
MNRTSRRGSKRIFLQNTNICGLNFFGRNLFKTKFEEVQIFNCNFNNASLQQVEWTKITWDNVEIFNSKNREIIEGIIFSPNNKTLVSCRKNTVYIWNQQTKKIEKQLNVQMLENFLPQFYQNFIILQKYYFYLSK